VIQLVWERTPLNTKKPDTSYVHYFHTEITLALIMKVVIIIIITSLAITTDL
jgi:hypothetical protein